MLGHGAVYQQLAHRRIEMPLRDVMVHREGHGDGALCRHTPPLYFSFLPAAFFGAPPPTTASRACRASLFGFSRSSLSRLRNSLSSFPFVFSSAQRAAKRSRCACSAAFSGAFSTRRASRAWRRFSLRTLIFQALPSALHQPPRCTSHVQPGGARPRGRGMLVRVLAPVCLGRCDARRRACALAAQPGAEPSRSGVCWHSPRPRATRTSWQQAR